MTNRTLVNIAYVMITGGMGVGTAALIGAGTPGLAVSVLLGYTALAVLAPTAKKILIRTPR